VVYKIFNVTLKFKEKNFMAETAIIIIIEKATCDDPMVIAVLLRISHHISGLQQKVKYCPVYKRNY